MVEFDRIRHCLCLDRLGHQYDGTLFTEISASSVGDSPEPDPALRLVDQLTRHLNGRDSPR